MEDKIYTVKEVADYFKVSAPAVHNWINRGQINTTATPGSEYRITESEIKRVLESKKNRR